MNSENVHGTSFADSMIRKFTKNGKLKINIAIDPINPVPAMVPNKSSTKDTAGSQTQNSGKSLHFNTDSFFLVYTRKVLGKINNAGNLSLISASPKMMVILQNAVKKVFPLLEGVYFTSPALQNGRPVWQKEVANVSISCIWYNTTFSLMGGTRVTGTGRWNIGLSNSLHSNCDFHEIYSIDQVSGPQEASKWRFFDKSLDQWITTTDVCVKKGMNFSCNEKKI